MSLPLAWVDRIWEKLSVTYGAEFLSRWRGFDSTAINAVKSDWMNELSAFENAPHAIAFALANLPEKPPNVVAFKAICRLAPSAETPALPGPKADPARVKAELAKLSDLRASTVQKSNGRDWAQRIIQRVKAGEKISPTVVQMAMASIRGE